MPEVILLVIWAAFSAKSGLNIGYKDYFVKELEGIYSTDLNWVECYSTNFGDYNLLIQKRQQK